MWHEARKQERKIRVMMVDYKKRADRRRQYYERIRQDPTQFMRVYGRPSKIHWEHSVALAAEGPQSQMPWQGDHNIIIDRFDVRAHLDFIPEIRSSTPEPTKQEEEEERKASYERYRILVQNEVVGVPEEQCLRQIYMDELYGAVDNKKAEDDKKKQSDKKVAIGYTYEDSTNDRNVEEPDEKVEEEDEASSDEEIDLDNIIDIYNLTDEQAQMLNEASLQYGMKGLDYECALQLDKEEAEALRLAKLLEEEKAQFSGRKSRRERRAFKEKRLKDRPSSPPSYAARDSPKYEPYKKDSSSSRSRSRSPAEGAPLLFITSFGGESSDEGGPVQGPTLPPQLQAQSSVSASRLKRSPRRKTSATAVPEKPSVERRKRSRSSSSKSRSRSPRRRYSGRRSNSRARSYSRSRSFSRPRRGSRSRSRSLSRPRRGSRSRSRSLSRPRRGSRSRSRRSYSSSRSRSGSFSRSFSRSRSRSRSGSRSRRSERRSASPQPIKRYRRPSLSSNASATSTTSGDSDGAHSGGEGPGSDSRGSSQANDSSRRDTQHTMLGKVHGQPSKGSLTPAERMKQRMQKALNKQYKADLKTRRQKMTLAERERQDREEELRAMAIQLRRREREKRHKDLDPDSPAWEETWRPPPAGSSRGGLSRSRSPEPPRAPRDPPPPPPPPGRESRGGRRDGQWDRERERERPGRSPPAREKHPARDWPRGRDAEREREGDRGRDRARGGADGGRGAEGGRDWERRPWGPDGGERERDRGYDRGSRSRHYSRDQDDPRARSPRSYSDHRQHSHRGRPDRERGPPRGPQRGPQRGPPGGYPGGFSGGHSPCPPRGGDQRRLVNY